MGALGAEFPHYAVFAPSDHDLLIVASASPLPAAAERARVRAARRSRKELWTVHVLTRGRPRRALPRQPRDARAAVRELRHAGELGLRAGARPQRRAPPLHRAQRRRHRSSCSTPACRCSSCSSARAAAAPVNPLFRGRLRASTRIENTRLAWYARNFLVAPAPPEPRAVADASCRRTSNSCKLRLIECRQPRELDVWLHSALRVAQAINPYLSPDDLNAVWPAFMVSRCYATLNGLQRRWLAFFRAVAARDAPSNGGARRGAARRAARAQQ